MLADRVGIIDRGVIVAEGTPDALKAEIGRPSVEATPSERADRDAVAEVLSRFGSVVPAPPGAAAVRLESGENLAEVVRALDAAELRIADLQLHQPSLDDVFLAKTGRKLDVSSRRRAGGRGVNGLALQTYEMARRSVLQTLRQPAMVIPPILFPLILMGINVSGLDAATQIPGFPTDSYLDFAIAFPFIQGVAVRVDQRGQRGRARRRDRAS